MGPPSIIELVLIEDNKSDIELTLYALERNNIANCVKVLQDGAVALSYFFGSENEPPEFDENYRPKVILLDLKLPKVSGLEVLKALKESPKTKLIPVVALTASDEHTDLLRSYGLGINGYIVKPIDFDKFSKAMKVVGAYWLLVNNAPPKAL